MAAAAAVRAGDSPLPPEMQNAMGVLHFAASVHEMKFGSTPGIAQLRNGLKALETAELIYAIAVDPERGAIKAIDATLTGAISSHPVVAGLILMGDASEILLPHILETQEKLKTAAIATGVTAAEYSEATAIFRLLAAGRQALREATSGAATAAVELTKERVISLIGKRVPDAPAKVDAVAALVYDFHRAISAPTKADFALMREAASVVISPPPSPGTDAPPRPPSFGFKIVGGAGAGLSAAVTISLKLTPFTFGLSAGVAALMATLHLIMRNKDKEKAQEFRGKATKIQGEITGSFAKLTHICEDLTITPAAKIAALKALITEVEGLHAGVSKLDKPFGGNVARPYVDGFRSAFNQIKHEAQRIIEALSL